MGGQIANRRVAILIGDGYDPVAFNGVYAALKAAKAFPFVIGPKRQTVLAEGQSKGMYIAFRSTDPYSTPFSSDKTYHMIIGLIAFFELSRYWEVFYERRNANFDFHIGGSGVQPDHHFEGMRSTMFDSIFVPGGSHIETLRKQGCVVHCTYFWHPCSLSEPHVLGTLILQTSSKAGFTLQTGETDSEIGVREAFGHLKAIGATGEAVNLVKTACEVDGMKFSAADSHDVVDSYGVVTAGATRQESFKETINMAKGAKDFIDAYTFNISQHKNFDRELDGLSSMVAY